MMRDPHLAVGVIKNHFCKKSILKKIFTANLLTIIGSIPISHQTMLMIAQLVERKYEIMYLVKRYLQQYLVQEGT